MMGGGLTLNRFEELEKEAYDNEVNIYNYYLGEPDLKGIYIDGNIAINSSVDTTIEKACVLAEELGHHYTTVGDIMDMSISWNRKQERQARFNGYNRLIGLTRLVGAYEHGCSNRSEIAEFLEVTEEYLQECIDCYCDKYGVGIHVSEYYVMFIPHLSIGKVI